MCNDNAGLQYCIYNKYNDRGSATDASSFENIFYALDFIDECNELREKHGLSALKVTDLMMAYAISDANYASQNISHPMQFGVGENLAWGYTDPFAG